MPTGRVSKKTVDALTCPVGKDRVILWDNSLAGFGVCGFKTGLKTYIVQYRQNGRSRRAQIGKHGRLTPEEARSQAKMMLGLVETGADPIAEKSKARRVQTFQEVADDFLKLHAAPKRKTRTYAEYERLLVKVILPVIGSSRMTDLRRVDVARLHSQISSKAPVTANRAIAIVSAVWSWASRRDITSDAANPCRGLERNREIAKERYLTTEEFGRLGEALRLAETDGIPWTVDETHPRAKHIAKPVNRKTVADPYAVAAIRLLILTGARLDEILKAEWSRVDLERGILFLADSKTGKKPIYLSAAAMNVIADIKRIDGNPYLIAGKKAGRPRADLKKPWGAIRKTAGLDDVRIHDLRHTFASFGAGASLGLPIIGKLLGHSQPATTARYAHLDADPMHRAVNTIGSTISASMNRSSTATVIPLSRTHL